MTGSRRFSVINEPVCEKTNNLGFRPGPTLTTLNSLDLKIARSLKGRRMKEEEGLYNTCSENKGADQLRGYREAGLSLCFRICRLLVFFCSGSNILQVCTKL